MPDRYLVTHAFIKDEKNEDLQDFIQETIEECFEILDNGIFEILFVYKMFLKLQQNCLTIAFSVNIINFYCSRKYRRQM